MYAFFDEYWDKASYFMAKSIRNFAEENGLPQKLQWDDNSVAYLNMLTELHKFFMHRSIGKVSSIQTYVKIYTEYMCAVMSPSLPNTIAIFVSDYGIAIKDRGVGFVNELNGFVRKMNINPTATDYALILTNVPLECYYSIISAMVRDDMVMIVPPPPVEMDQPKPKRVEIEYAPIIQNNSMLIKLYHMHIEYLQKRAYEFWKIPDINTVMLNKLRDIESGLHHEYINTISTCDDDAMILSFFDRVTILHKILLVLRWKFRGWNLATFYIRKSDPIYYDAIKTLREEAPSEYNWLVEYTNTFKNVEWVDQQLRETVVKEKNETCPKSKRKNYSEPYYPISNMWEQSYFPIQTGDLSIDESIRRALSYADEYSDEYSNYTY